SLGHMNQYLTPAKNQTQVINDLLGTEAFRKDVAVRAGLVDKDASETQIRAAAENIKAWATARGANLVTIVGEAGSAAHAQAIAAGILAAYQDRGTAELEHDSGVATDYYSQQLDLAKKELGTRQAALSSYLAANPKAADPTNAASGNIDYKTLVDRV